MISALSVLNHIIVDLEALDCTRIMWRMWQLSLISILVLCLFLEITATVGIPPSKNSKIHRHAALRIIGGEKAVPHIAPYIVVMSLRTWDSKSVSCGGTLLSNKHILTAASCLHDGGEINVMLFSIHNQHKAEKDWQRRYVGKIIIHEEHNIYTRTHDIAMIVLTEPVKLTPTVQPVALPDAKAANETYVGEVTQAYGWGWVHDSDRVVVPDELMTVNLTIISNEECHRQLRRVNYPFLYEYELCTSGEDIVGTCNGDTGGPLVLNGTLVGVAIVGTGYCELGYPSKFVSVGQHLNWIQEKMKL